MHVTQRQGWLMRLALGSSSVLVALACAAPPPPRQAPPKPADPISGGEPKAEETPVHTAPPPVFGNRVVKQDEGAEIEEPRAVAIAKDKAEKAGYELEKYELQSTDLDEGSYFLHFKLRSKGRPGAHFSVEVNATTGDARLIPGR